MPSDLKARMLVQACIRAATFKTLPSVVLRRGDPDAGVIYVKVLARDGRAVLFVQTRDAAGAPAWRRSSGETPVPEADIDEKIDRDARIDSDLWAIEVLDDAFAHPLDPKLI